MPRSVAALYSSGGEIAASVSKVERREEKAATVTTAPENTGFQLSSAAAPHGLLLTCMPAAL